MRRPPSPSAVRVLYVTPFAEAVSGPDESLLLLLRHLGGAVEAGVALPPKSPFRDRYVALGARVFEMPISRIQRFQTPGELAWYGKDLARGTAALRRAAREWEPELVHANMEVCLEAGLVARALGVPAVTHYRGNTLDEPKVVFDVLTRVWSGLSDRIWAISEGCADIFRKRGLGERVEVLYNALELGELTRSRDGQAVRRSLGIAPTDAVVLTVARLHPRKDLETFVRAASQVETERPVHWIVAGSAHGEEALRYEERLRALIGELGLGGRVRLLGSRSDVPDLLSASDLFVMTSRHEGFGRAAAEAMAAGRACVLSREGAFPELVDDGVHGVLCTPGSSEEFARAVRSLLADPDQRRALGAHARRRAIDRYDARRQAEHVLRVYEDLVGRKHVTPAASPNPIETFS